MNISKQVVILSAENSTNTFEGNRQRTTTLEGMLEDIGLPFERATGVYKGQREASFVVIVRDETDIDILKGFAFNNFNQEAVLLQDSNQEAHLIFRNGSSERLGRLEQVSEEIAMSQDSFTLLNDSYYITVPR